ncbi:PQQ-binding-like beta-propeller repeat protein [Streptomyces sp. NPDC050704]|uniref:outer membrane protein assembly factor BamB family protein n=1 Tax=Streptomyces sp. NPDC050704 TaxID=3157219 RepID=UPI003447FB7E
MNADQLNREDKVRDALRNWPLDAVRAPGDLAEQVVARRRRRTRLRSAAVSGLAVVGIAAGSLIAVQPGDDARPQRGGVASPTADPLPADWKPWGTALPSVHINDCLPVGDALYCNGQGYVALKVDARTGKTLWSVKEGKGGGDSYGGTMGGVRDGIVYTFADRYPGTSYERTDLTALDADTGKELWRHGLADDHRDTTAAIPIEGGVFANTPRFKTMKGLDARTGKELWEYKWGKGIHCERTAVAGVPYVICGREKDRWEVTLDVIRLDPRTGEAKKVASIPGATAHTGNTADSLVFAEYEGDQPLYQATGISALITVDADSGKVDTKPVRDVPAGGTSLVGDVVFVSRQARLTALDADSGEKLWSRELALKLDPGKGEFPMPERLSDPAVIDGRQVAYVLSSRGELVGVDLADGKQVWSGSVELPKLPEGADPRVPQLIPYRDVLLGRANEHLFALRPEPTG